jgi:diaminopropionate ammonia-lyase
MSTRVSPRLAKKAKTTPKLEDELKAAAATWEVRYVPNELAATPAAPYPGKEAVSAESAADARAQLIGWENYAPTPLVELKELASLAGVESVVCKDESGRFGTGSFKALGGALAVADCHAADPSAVVVTASAGNHGLGVAWGARRVGLKSKIYLAPTVSEAIACKMRALGAEVVRVEGTYEDSCAKCAQDCDTHGWKLIQDGSSPGYEAVPKRIHVRPTASPTTTTHAPA